MTTFTGFPAEAWEFLDRLAADNTSAYFNDHRVQYRQAIAIPAATFVDSFTPMLPDLVHRDLQGEARFSASAAQRS